MIVWDSPKPCAICSLNTIIIMRIFSWLFLGFLLFLCGCSQFKRTPTSLAWHNMNARFNAHLIARDNIRYAQQILEDTTQEDYALMLPLQWSLDSQFTRPIHKHAEVAMKMTSLVAERHANSKFLYPSYLMLGQARQMRGHIEDAEEVFKYVNSQPEAIKYQSKALLGLLRGYLYKQDQEAIATVIQALKQQPLSQTEKQEFLLLNAYYHQLTQEWALSAAFLDEAIALQRRSFQKGRNLYIAGQLYEVLGRTDLARQRFMAVAKQPVPYPMRFQSQINATLYTRGGNLQQNLEKLGKDPRNEVIQDQIAYKLGEMAENNADWEKALGYYKKSIQVAQPSSAMRGKAYIAIADLLYDEFQSYEQAKLYYDSALAVLPPSTDAFQMAQQKSKSLQEFVRHWQTIQLEDSLQTLATYSLEKLRDIAQTSLKKETSKPKTSPAPPAKSGQRWALVDPMQLARDKVAFVSLWGSRPLEDHWRRKDKEAGTVSFQIIRDQGVRSDSVKSTNKSVDQALENRLAAWEKVIPRTTAQKLASQLKQENAYFQIGKIYKLQLNEPENARITFRKILEDYPNSMNEAEVLYFLALLDGTPENPYQRLLIDRYPSSLFAKQIASGPVAVTADLEERARLSYAQLLQMYENQEFTTGSTLAEQAYYQFIGTKYQDRIAYLRILFLSKGTQIESYKMALQEFLANHPTSSFSTDIRERQKIVNP